MRDIFLHLKNRVSLQPRTSYASPDVVGGVLLVCAPVLRSDGGARAKCDPTAGVSEVVLPHRVFRQGLHQHIYM